LEVILQNGGNLKETSVQMFVHYNTIRYRSRLMSQLLGYPLTPSNAFQDLGLAIKIYNTLHIPNTK
ncbi:MAG: helix-turn-helix domain-containing protein, partial [Oscillospiraceae bacterium]